MIIHRPRSMGRSALNQQLLDQLTKEQIRQGKDVWIASTPAKPIPKAIYMDEWDSVHHMADAWAKSLFSNIVRDGKAAVVIGVDEIEPEKVIPLNSDKPRTKAIVW